MNVVLARRLRRVRVNGAVIDGPHVGLAVPSVKRPAVPELHVSGVIVVGDWLRTSLTALSSRALRRAHLSRSTPQDTRDGKHWNEAPPRFESVHRRSSRVLVFGANTKLLVVRNQAGNLTLDGIP